MKKILLAGVLFLAMLFPSYAFSSVTLDNITLTATYTEPNVNIDGTPLTDLSHTTIYYDIGSGRIKVMDVVASSATGGGAITQSFTIDTLAGSEADVLVIYTASDFSGNESSGFIEPTIRIDQLSPGNPIGQ